jgi:hypothetical protein
MTCMLSKYIYLQSYFNFESSIHLSFVTFRLILTAKEKTNFVSVFGPSN